MFGAAAGTCTASPGPGRRRRTSWGPARPTRRGPTCRPWARGTWSTSIRARTTSASCSPTGHPAAPITVRGVGGFAASVIDGSAAVCTPDLVNRPAAQGLGAFTIGKRAGMTFGYSPGHVVVRNLRFTRAYVGTGSGGFSAGGTRWRGRAGRPGCTSSCARA
jgi:hypothetical protein